MTEVLFNDMTRMFFIKNRAGPPANPVYEGLWAAGQPTFNQGAPTPVRIPDKDGYRKFKTISKLPGNPDLPTLPLTARQEVSVLSSLLEIAKGGCDHDIQVHAGACANPQDFARGYERVWILEAARIGNYSYSGPLGTLEPGNRAVLDEQVEFAGDDLYEVKPITFSEQAASVVTREIVDVAICDRQSCGGDCGLASDGCQRVFMISLSQGGSPGLSADIIYTDDGGATWAKTHVTTLAADEDPNAMACVGDNLVVISEDSESLHYADITDILNAVEAWTEVTTGFVATKGPLAIFAAGPNDVFIVGEGGYVYYTNDPTSGVEVQNAGAATVQDLNAVHGIDDQHVVAVGASNAVVVTHDGGATWASRTGPDAGVILSAVWMVTKDIYWVGTAAGKLWYTLDDGTTWTAKGFPGSGSGYVRDLYFPTRSVGYMAHSTTTPAGRVLRTIDGGGHWIVAPEKTGSIPANDRVNAIVACDPNVAFGGGLADNATDGFAVKVS